MQRAEARSLRVTVGQIRLTGPGGVLGQVRAVLAAANDSDLVVLPEFTTHGDRIDLDEVAYLKGEGSAREDAQKWISLTPAFAKVKALADRHRKAIIVGCLEQEGGKLYSRAYFYDPAAAVLKHYDKSHVHWTEKFLRPGQQLRPLETRFGRIGVLICYDLAFVEPTRVLALRDADALVVISAIPRRFHWKYPYRRMIGAAIFNQYFVVAANLGYSKRAPMGGHSLVLDAQGDTLAHQRNAKSGHITATLDRSAMDAWRKTEVIPRYRRPELYAPVCDQRSKE